MYLEKVKDQSKTEGFKKKPQNDIVKECLRKPQRPKAYPRSRSARSMRLRCTVVLGTLNGNQLRTSSSSPMPCM